MKLNKVIYQKLLLQAQEAQELGLKKLATGVLTSVGSTPRDDDEKCLYSSVELSNDVYNNIWKIALDVVKYYDLESVDIQKLDEIITSASKKIQAELEISIGFGDDNYMVGPLEPKLPGESK